MSNPNYNDAESEIRYLREQLKAARTARDLLGEDATRLLAALEMMLTNWPENRDGMDYDGPLPVGVLRCRAAVAKARGES